MPEWRKVKDVARFLADKGQRRTGPHAMTGRVLNWAHCSRCGLLALKNDATRRALKEPCVWYEDP
jgi:hypothetical protein